MNSSTDPSRHPILNAPVKCWHAFKHLTQLSFPRSYPIVQFPNAPGATYLAPATFGQFFNTFGRTEGFGTARQVQFGVRYTF